MAGIETREVPGKCVGVLPASGVPELWWLVLTPTADCTISVEFCDHAWKPLGLGASYAATAGTDYTLASLIGGVASIPSGAKRVRCYTTGELTWNFGGASDWTVQYAPTIDVIPADTEFDFPEVA